MASWPVRHLSVGIDRPFAEVYGFLAEPASFSRWASGLGQALRPLGGLEWAAETPMGPMRIRFTERNAFGVLDHTLVPADGPPMHNPMRVIPCGDGCAVVFSLLRRPGTSEVEHARDVAWVSRDLAALRALLEAGAATPGIGPQAGSR